jgi:release factor glutamine methyltransferase
MQGIYQPAEDSYLLKETLEKYLNKIKDKNIKIIDLGSGSGIQAETCRELGFNNIITVDINNAAVKHLKKLGFKSINSDLFSKLYKKEKFNLIIFNPPYLPEDKLEPKDSRVATTAGKQGYELIIKFLNQAKEFLNSKGSILLLFSSLSHPAIILKQAKQLKYEIKLLNKQKIFFEELFVYEFKK